MPLSGQPAVDAAAGRKFVSPVDTALGPFSNAAAVTPDNSNDLDFVTLAIYVGSAGSLALNLPDGTPVTFAAVPAGTTIPIRAGRVLAAGTSAGGIIAMW
jgi:hypothetical protein